MTLTGTPSAGPEVSPDGRFITYLALQDGIHVWKANVDGTNPVQLTKGIGESDPHWSGDGRWVVFRGGADGQIYKIPADGGEPSLVAPVKGTNNLIVFPDGSRLAFRAWDASAKRSRTLVIPFDGGETLAALDTPPENHPWSPDGRSIVYSLENDGVSNLWARPPDGGPARQITRFRDDQINEFAFSRDGTQIAPARGRSSSDVVLITDFR